MSPEDPVVAHTPVDHTQRAVRGRLTPSRFVADVSLRWKILTLVGVAVLLTVAVGVIGQQAVASVQTQVERITGEAEERCDLAFEARANWADYRQWTTRRALTQGTPQASGAETAMLSSYEATVRGLAELQRINPTPAQQALISKALRNIAASRQAVETVHARGQRLGVSAESIRAQGAALAELVDPPSDEVNSTFEKLTENYESALAAEGVAAGATASASVRTLLVVIVLGASLLIAFGAWIARLISSSVGRMRDALVSLADGDLAHPVPVHGRDELGQMAAALAAAQAGLRLVLGEIGKTSSTLADSAVQLSAVSAQVASNSEEASAQADALGSTAAQVSSNVQAVAAGTEQMTSSIREIAQSSAEAVRVAQAAVAEAASANRTVDRLGASSNEIGNVVKAITSIAGQTNLLALNATIEAARAGEAGKGFAVVAEEVKQLARETARATDDISRRVQTIQADTLAAVDAIGRISQTIEDVNAYQTTIASAVEEQTATTAEISRTIGEAAGGSASIAADVGSVSRAAQSSSRGIADAQRAAAGLADMSANLQVLVAKFRS